MKYFRKLVGDKCYLSPLSLDDIEKYTEWVNDMETGMFMLFATGVYDLDKEKRQMQQLMENNVIFAIIDKDSNKLVGNCGLHEVNSVHRKAVFGIFIGDKNYWNSGIGTEATKLILDFGFNVLNLHQISLDVIEYNKRAIRCYEKAGFQLMGRKRQTIFIAGKYHDMLYYDILAEEFTSPYVMDLFEKGTRPAAGLNKISIV
jgi:RimJ/RimL family protein N-acetyltransferase